MIGSTDKLYDIESFSMLDGLLLISAGREGFVRQIKQSTANNYGKCFLKQTYSVH
jgi:hypothetical protein